MGKNVVKNIVSNTKGLCLNCGWIFGVTGVLCIVSYHVCISVISDRIYFLTFYFSAVESTGKLETLLKWVMNFQTFTI